MNESEIIIYSSPDGLSKVKVIFNADNYWLTQKRMAELFAVGRPAITKHLKNIFKEGELEENSVCSILEHTAIDGKKYNTKFYNLDAIVSVGYRVNSFQATRFRQWATRTLKEYIIKGFVLDDERMKQGEAFGKDYFEELLERIREIRASERRLQTYMLNAVSIIVHRLLPQFYFIKLFKINCIGQSRVILLQK